MDMDSLNEKHKVAATQDMTVTIETEGNESIHSRHRHRHRHRHHKKVFILGILVQSNGGGFIWIWRRGTEQKP